jgi:cysteine-rich repeat protein
LEGDVNLKFIAAIGVGVAGVTLVGRWGLSMLTQSTEDTASEQLAASADAVPHTVESCGKMPNGTLCGTRGSGTLCIDESCVRNVCGDSIVVQGEQCDDGNHSGGDGCSDTCRWEKLDSCGNGTVDANEECDDANDDDEDHCTSRCKAARCGDGFASAMEECDDGNSDDTDDCTGKCKPPTPEQVLADRARRAGSPIAAAWMFGKSGERGGESAAGARSAAAGAAGGAGAASGAGGAGGSGSGGKGSGANAPGEVSANVSGDAGVNDKCQACREANCRNVLGADILAGCMEAVNSTFGAPAGDPEFVQQCSEVVACARENQCAYRAERQAAPCYCGSISVDECQEKGPAEDAPCMAEWQAATRTTNNALVLTRFSDLAFPAGWAYQLLDCDRLHCNDCQTL